MWRRQKTLSDVANDIDSRGWGISKAMTTMLNYFKGGNLET